MRDLCIATSRRDEEQVYQELYRRADTGEPYLLEIDLEKETRKKHKLSPAAARDVMRQWEIAQAGELRRPGKRGILSIRPSRERGYKLKCGGLFLENSEGKPKTREFHRRAGLNIIEVAESLGYRDKLKPAKHGKKMICINPDHQETKPSLYLNGKKDCFHCFGCGIAGGIVKFYALAKGISPEQAGAAMQSQDIRIKTSEARGTHKPRRNKPKRAGYSHIYEAFIKHLQGYEPERRAVEYLHQERLLTEETIKQFNLCILPAADTAEYKQAREFLLATFKRAGLEQAGIFDGSGRVAFYQHRIIIPVMQDFKVMGLQGRYFDKAGNTEPPERDGKYKNTAGGEFKGILFNGDILRIAEPGDRVILCEGAFDTMLCYQEQRRKLRATVDEAEPVAVGIFSLTAWTEQNIKELAKYDLTIALHRDKDQKTGQETRQSIEARRNIAEIYNRNTGRDAEAWRLPLGVDICELYKRRRSNG